MWRYISVGPHRFLPITFNSNSYLAYGDGRRDKATADSSAVAMRKQPKYKRLYGLTVYVDSAICRMAFTPNSTQT